MQLCYIICIKVAGYSINGVAEVYFYHTWKCHGNVMHIKPTRHPHKDQPHQSRWDIYSSLSFSALAKALAIQRLRIAAYKMGKKCINISMEQTNTRPLWLERTRPRHAQIPTVQLNTCKHTYPPLLCHHNIDFWVYLVNWTIVQLLTPPPTYVVPPVPFGSNTQS